MTRSFARLALIMTAVLTGACATVPGASVGGQAVPPVSEMPVSGATASAKIHVDLGLAYYEIGGYAVALDEARIAVGFDSGYAPAYELMGLVYMAIDDMPAARDSFLRALALAPNDPAINNSYGWFQCVAGEWQDGLSRLGAAARNPYYRTPSRPYTYAGLCHLRKGDDAAAETEFRRAVQVDPANRQAIYHLAAIAYRRGAYDNAHSYMVAFHQQGEPSAASVWLGLRAARKVGNGDAEASYEAQLRGRFAASAEYQAMIQGKYE